MLYFLHCALYDFHVYFFREVTARMEGSDPSNREGLATHGHKHGGTSQQVLSEGVSVYVIDEGQAMNNFMRETIASIVM